MYSGVVLTVTDHSALSRFGKAAAFRAKLGMKIDNPPKRTSEMLSYRAREMASQVRLARPTQHQVQLHKDRVTPSRKPPCIAAPALAQRRRGFRLAQSPKSRQPVFA
jgi:hypothetical protein